MPRPDKEAEITQIMFDAKQREEIALRDQHIDSLKAELRGLRELHGDEDNRTLRAYLEWAGWGPCNSSCACGEWHKVRDSREERELYAENRRLRAVLAGIKGVAGDALSKDNE